MESKMGSTQATTPSKRASGREPPDDPPPVATDPHQTGKYVDRHTPATADVCDDSSDASVTNNADPYDSVNVTERSRQAFANARARNWNTSRASMAPRQKISPVHNPYSPTTPPHVLTGALANRVDKAISKPSTAATPNNSNDTYDNNYEDYNEEYNVELNDDDDNPLNDDNIDNDDDEPNNESDDDNPDNGSDNNTSHSDGGSDANNNPDGQYNGYDDGSNGYDNEYDDGSYDNYNNDSYKEKYDDRYRNECTQQKCQAIDVCTHDNGEQQSSPPPAATNVATPPYRTAVPWATSNAAITPFIITIFDPTSSGGVLHLHKVLGLPLPPPKTSQSNSPRLHTTTLAYHRPRAPNNYPKPIFTQGS
jgi:hypothetical protein